MHRQEPAPAKAGGKARAPYEFGCKVSVATPATKPKGGQFVLHATALHGNPFDGHAGACRRRAGASDRRRNPPHPRRKGYRGHNHPEKFRVWITGQATGDRPDPPRNEAPRRRRAGHRPPEGRAPHGPHHFKGRAGNRANAVLAAAGYNFALLLRWLARLLGALFRALLSAPPYLENAA